VPLGTDTVVLAAIAPPEVAVKLPVDPLTQLTLLELVLRQSL